MDIEWLKSHVFPYVNFLFFVTLLYYFAKRPILRGFEQRRKDFLKAKEDAQQALNAAHQAYGELEKQMQSLDLQAREIREASLRSAEKEASDIIDKAKALADHIIAEAQQRSQAQAAEVLDSAKKELMEAALSEAKAKIRGLFESEPSQAKALLSRACKQVETAKFEGLR